MKIESKQISRYISGVLKAGARKGCLPTLVLSAFFLSVPLGWIILETGVSNTNPTGKSKIPGVITNAALTPGFVHATLKEATETARINTPTPDSDWAIQPTQVTLQKCTSNYAPGIGDRSANEVPHLGDQFRCILGLDGIVEWVPID